MAELLSVIHPVDDRVQFFMGKISLEMNGALLPGIDETIRPVVVKLILRHCIEP
jgi:hypothetical protein